MKTLMTLVFTLLLSTIVNALEPINAKAVTSYEQLAFDQQANKAPDRELVKRIREELSKDPQLSKNGKNIKIIIVKKEIVLKGPVNSENEKSKIISMADKLKADHTIRDQIEIAKEQDLIKTPESPPPPPAQ